MESITSLKNAATRAIWGDEQAHQEEPISGEVGNVSKGEPYDAGNMEPAEVDAKFTAPGTQHQDNLGTDVTESKDLPATKADSTTGQNDVRDPSDPSAQHDKAGAKENVDDSGAGLDVGDNPEKINGPGPRPIEEVAREHGGDAGKSGSDVNIPRERGGADSQDEGEDHDELSRGHGDGGTGELYVKSSGLKADGGDFDAAAPGAGREADRLLEEKGVHPYGAHVDGDRDKEGDGGTSHHKDKVSLKTKIKAKLHRSSVATTS